MKPPDGDPFHLSGRFLEIDPPSRLVYTFSWEEPAPDDRETVVKLTLDAQADGTRVSLSHGLFTTEERRTLHRNGWTDSFEKLHEILKVRGQGTPAQFSPGGASISAPSRRPPPAPLR